MQSLIRRGNFGYQEKELFHFKVMSENIQISLPAKIEAILYLKGRPTSSKEMAELLEKDWEIIPGIWNVTSYSELRKEAEIVERYNLIHPNRTQKKSYETLKYRNNSNDNIFSFLSNNNCSISSIINGFCNILSNLYIFKDKIKNII